MRPVSSAVLVVLLLVSAATAQLPTVSETIDVLLIEVPVNVIGSNNEPVRGLTRENFELYADGKKQRISQFDVVDFGAIAGGGGEDTSAPLPLHKRNFLLLFDLNHTTPATLTRARTAASEFVKKQALPGDRVAVASISVQGGLKLLASFTTDRVLALRAIESLAGPTHFARADPLMLTAATFEEVAANVTGTGPVDQAIADHYREQAAAVRLAANDERRHFVMRELDELARLGRLLDRIRGRKQVVLLSEGFDAKMLHGREQLTSDEAGRELAAVQRGAIWAVDSDSRYGNTEAANALKAMVSSLRRSDVILHAVDIKGVRTDVDPSAGVQRVSNESLYLVTRDTGGTVFKNDNNLSDDFGRMLKQQEVTYFLAFQTSAKEPGKFHELKVRLAGTPGAKIIHRPGFYEPSRAMSQLDRTLTAAEIIMNRLPVEEIRIRALAAAFPRPDGKADVPVILEIDGRSLMKGSNDRTAAAEIFIYALDESEIIRDYAVQPVSFDLNKLRGKLEQKGVKFYHTLRVQPGRYSIRVFVRNGAGLNGFRETTVDVPEMKAGLAAPPLVIDEGGEWVMVKAADREGAGPYPFMAGERMFVPAVAPILSPGATREVALIGYNLAGTFDLDAQLHDEDGSKPVGLTLLGRTPADSDGKVTYMVKLTPPQMALGSYTLVMNLREKGTAVQRTVSIPIQLR